MAKEYVCSITDCSNRVYGRGMCSAHYQRWRRRKADGQTDIEVAKVVVCTDCGSLVEYVTSAPKRCKECRKRKHCDDASAHWHRDVDLSRQRDRHRSRLRAAKEGRVIGDPVRHQDRSTEAIKRRQAETCRLYRERNPEKRKESAARWAAANRAKSIAYQRDRYHSDPQFNAVTKLRKRVGLAIKRAGRSAEKADQFIALLGCSFSELKRHIERQFSKGMTWEHVISGEVHLDHIRPCSSFDLLDPVQQYECFHFMNIQPLWAADNLKKHSSRQLLL